jgi:polyferredoxin
MFESMHPISGFSHPFLASAAGEGDGSGGLNVKLFQEPLLPVAGTSVDLTPFVLMAGMLTVSSICLRIDRGPAWLATAGQSLAAALWGLTVFLVGRALIDPAGPWLTWENAAVVGVMGTVSAAFLLLFWEAEGVRQSFRLASQSASFSAFVLSIHPCACLVRDAMIGLQYLNADNLRAFEFLIVIVTVSGFTLVWGRSFCGWVCPIGFVQEMVSKLTAWTKRLADQRTVKAARLAACGLLLAGMTAGYVWLGPAELPLYQGMLVYWVFALLALTMVVIAEPRWERRLRPVRYASLILFAATIYLGTYLNGVFCVLLKNILAKPTVILFVGVMLTTLLLSQAWCRFLCPEGALLGWLTRASGWRIELDKSKCSGCNVCKDVCPVEAIDVGRVVDDVCLYCAKCVDRCPTDALSMAAPPPTPGFIALPMAAAASAAAAPGRAP